MNRVTNAQPIPPRRGAVVVMIALCLVIIVAAMAFAVDGGYMFEKKRIVTSAAEAAASAAAQVLFEEYSENGGLDSNGTATVIALEYAAANGFSNVDPDNTVVVNIPPATGSYAGKSGYAEVLIRHNFPKTFSSIFSREPILISGRAVAAGGYVVSKASIVVLESEKKEAVKIKGASLKLAGDIMINSSDKKAMKLDKEGQIEADNIMVTGGIERKDKSNAKLKGDLTTGVEPVEDPLEDLPVPSKGPELNHEDYMQLVDGEEHYVLPPGYYPEKLEIKDASQVTFEPGVFYFGDEVKFKDEAQVYGSGVMFYMAGGKKLKFETEGSVSLSPPGTGTYQGVTIFMDREEKNKIYFKKDATLNISGTIYGANAEVKFQKVVAGIGFEEDEHDDEDLGAVEEGVAKTYGEIHSQLVVRKLKIDKHSQVSITGTGIDVDRPHLGIVE